MKKIVLLTIMAICHFTAARWHGHYDHNHHWGHHHDSGNSDDDRGSRDFHPPWGNSNGNSDSEDDSNDFRPWSHSTSSTTKSNPTVRQVNNDDIITNCVRSCAVTSEYNPVCGSNRVIYANPGRLECAQQCGVDVQLAERTVCGVVEAQNVSRSSLEACVAACPVTLDFMPVCGTNDVTYAHPDRLRCVQRCGVAVSIDKYDPCFRWPNLNNNLIQIELTACQQSCPVKVDYAPVCGNDGRTYRNSDSLQCARKCGINVNIKSQNKCPENTLKPNVVTESSTGTRDPTPLTSRPTIDSEKDRENPNKDKNKEPNMKEVMACMQLCPLTSDYLPICGTDGITYTNPGRLLCSQFCGIDVNVKKFAPCESAANVTFTSCNSGVRPTTTVEECLRSCPISAENRPVCGTNDLTYKNMEQLLCAKRCGIDVCVKKQSACDSGDSVTPTQANTPVIPTQANTPVTPTQKPIDKDNDTTGFTIDPDILHSLFPNDKTKSTDDDFDVDERFNDNISTEPTKPN